MTWGALKINSQTIAVASNDVHGFRSIVVDADGRLIARVFGPTEEESRANARLIAAAPDLLDAVRLGRAMRAAQAAYFKDRSRENLIASKQAEAAFDKAAAAVIAKAEDRS